MMTGADPRLERPSGCPKCAALLDAATCASASGARPRAGDLTICFYCGAFLVFDKELNQVELEDSIFAKLPAEIRDQLTKLRAAIVARARPGREREC